MIGENPWANDARLATITTVCTVDVSIFFRQTNFFTLSQQVIAATSDDEDRIRKLIEDRFGTAP